MKSSLVTYLVQRSHSPVLLIDNKGKIVAYSERWNIVFPLKDGDLVGQPLMTCFGGDDTLGQAFRKSLSGEGAIGESYFTPIASNRKVRVQWEMRPWLDERQQAELVLLECLVVEGAEMEIDDELSRFIISSADLFNGMQDSLVVQDMTGAIVYCNPNAEKSLGLSLEQMKGRTSIDPRWQAIREDGTNYPGEEHPITISRTRLIPVENEIMGVRRPDNSLVWFKVNAQVLFESSGNKPIGAIATFHDITALKEQQRRLELERTRHHLAAYAAGVGFWEYSLINGELVWDERTHELFGSDESNFGHTQNDFFHFLHPEDKTRVRDHIQKALEGTEDIDTEYRIEHPHLGIRYIRAFARITRNSKGQPEMLLGVNYDITELRQAEIQALQSEQRLNSILDNLNDVVWSAEGEPRRTIQFVSSKVRELTGYEAHELINRTGVWNKLVNPEDAHMSAGMEAEVVKTGHAEREFRILHKDGQERWVMAKLNLVKNVKGQAVRIDGIASDITARKNAELALLEEKDRLAGILMDTQVGTWEWNVQEDRITCNERWAEITGRTVNDFSGYGIRNWKELLHPEDESSCNARFDACLTGESEEYEHESRIRHKDGHWVWVHIRGKVVSRNSDGQALALRGTLADITERKILELERIRHLRVLEDQNRRLLNFAFIVSHNLRSHASNFAMLLQLYRDERDQVSRSELIDLMNASSDRLMETLDHLNEVVSITTEVNPKMKQINLLERLNNILDQLHMDLEEAGVEVKIDVQAGLSVSSVPAYLDSILYNLVSNAIKYRSTLRKPEIFIGASYSKDNRLCLTVRDNGLGMDLDKIQSRLFGMYKTFHGNANARGLGLFLTKSQVEAMGGTIKVSSQKDVGTEFIVYFAQDV